MPYAWRGANTQLVIAAPIDAGLQAPELGVAAVGLAGRGTAKKVVAQTGRLGLAVTGRTAQVRKVAQTGRLAVALPGFAEQSGISTIGAFTHITVRRDYLLATGAAPAGYVGFVPSGWLLNNTTTVPPVEVRAYLDSLGQISISLASNTDAGTDPPGSNYQVREVITGQPYRTYKVQIPHDQGPTVDLATLPVLP